MRSEKLFCIILTLASILLATTSAEYEREKRAKAAIQENESEDENYDSGDNTLEKKESGNKVFIDTDFEDYDHVNEDSRDEGSRDNHYDYVFSSGVKENIGIVSGVIVGLIVAIVGRGQTLWLL